MAIGQPFLGIYASQASGHLFTPAGAYEPLASITVPSGGLSSIVFGSIPQTYAHLQLRYTARTTVASSGTDGISITLNGSSSEQYPFAPENHQA